METSIKKNVTILILVQLTMKCIFKKNKHYLFSMINDVIQVNLKVYHGIEVILIVSIIIFLLITFFFSIISLIINVKKIILCCKRIYI